MWPLKTEIVQSIYADGDVKIGIRKRILHSIYVNTPGKLKPNDKKRGFDGERDVCV